MPASHLIWPLIPWAVANLFVLALTDLVWRRLRVRSRPVDPLIFVFLFLFLTTSLVMVCGLLGVLDPVAIGASSVVGCAVIFGWDRRRLRDRAARLAGWTRALKTRPWSFIDVALAGAVLLVAARILIHVWYLPPYVWDTLSYHLPKVAEWVQNGSLVIFDTPVDRTFWPANMELFQTWFVLFPHHDFLIDLACVPFYVLACASVGAIVRLLGLSRRWAVAAALIYGLTPAPLQHATTGKNDMPIAALYLFLFALLLDAKKDWTFPRRRLLLAFLAVGLALGMKPYIVFIAPGLLVVAVWAARGKPWRSLLGSSGRSDLPALTSAVLVGLASLLAGYWFLRNALIFGNPFYPAEPRIFGQYLFGADPEGWERQGVLMSFGAFTENLKAFFSQKVFDRVYFHFSLRDMTGWGWFAFACGWPALVYSLFTSAAVRWIGGAFAVSFLTLLTCVVPDPWNMRFAQWFPALFAVSFLVMLQRLRIRLLRLAFGVVAAACLTLNFIGTLDIGTLPPWMWQRMARFPVAERSTAALGLFIGRSYFDALEKLPAEEPIGYNTNYNGWIYPLYDADLSRRVRYVPIDENTDVLTAMGQREVRVLFVALPPPVVEQKIREAVARHELRPIGEGLFVVEN